MPTSRFYIYQHLRLSDDVVFYVGKGTGRRAWDHLNRNPHWHRTVKKHGLKVVIVKRNLSERKAFLLEASLIKKFGRRDLDTGTLVNLSDGGEGNSGRLVSKEQRMLMSKHAQERVANPEYRKSVARGMREWAAVPENRKELLRRAAKATKLSQSSESRSKMTATLRRMGKDPTLKEYWQKRAAVMHTAEAKEKNVESRKRYARTSEGRSKLLSSLAKGRLVAYTEEVGRKKSKSLKAFAASDLGKTLIQKAVAAGHTKEANLKRAASLSKPYPSLVSPDGVKHPAGVGLSKFARENGLSSAHLSSVIRGKLQHHKGWRLAR